MGEENTSAEKREREESVAEKGLRLVKALYEKYGAEALEEGYLRFLSMRSPQESGAAAAQRQEDTADAALEVARRLWEFRTTHNVPDNYLAALIFGIPELGTFEPSEEMALRAFADRESQELFNEVVHSSCKDRVVVEVRDSEGNTVERWECNAASEKDRNQLLQWFFTRTEESDFAAHKLCLLLRKQEQE